MRVYSYSMGFMAGSTPLPDPTGFSGEVADLDLSGERDATGLLHRDRVATKYPQEMRYQNIGWDMCQTILQAVSAASFSWTYPDPNTGALRTGTYYVGNRKWSVVWSPDDREWVADLTFSVIEY
jgi:hypothetical protein